jgi:hypothetical protein
VAAEYGRPWPEDATAAIGGHEAREYVVVRKGARPVRLEPLSRVVIISRAVVC